MQCKTILMIEDDRPIREMMKTILEIEGYKIITASNGLEGVKALEKCTDPPDLILLDMMMPVMNGWEFLDALKNRSPKAEIPVVVVSAYSEIAKSVNPAAIVTKPVQLNSLIKAIEQCAA